MVHITQNAHAVRKVLRLTVMARASKVMATGCRDHPVSNFAMRRNSLLLFSGAMFALAGCQTTPTSPPAAAPALQLVQSQPLVLAPDCNANGSFFVEFSVLSDGRTGRIQAPQGPACVQQALTAWVSSFRYSPPGRDTPHGVEWMMVTASKGT